MVTKRWVLVLLMVLGVTTPAVASSSQAPTLTVLSNTRADLVSDGQALVGLSTSTTKGLRVTVGSRDVTKAFARRASGRVEGLVDGLRVGTNVVTASVGSATRSLTITNHPNGGPLFTGPQLQPWSCPAGSLDKQCDAKPRYTYLYLSSNPQKAGLQPYGTDTPPTDVATTTTDQGVKVPFIVRQELGYQDRDQYKVLTLIDPHKKWDRWAPQRTWNHKVLVTGGGGCGGSYGTGNAPLADFSGTIPTIPGRNDSYVDALGMGYAVMTTALDNTGHNCNVAVEAEALIMLKERVIEQYGDIRYTIGTGCSGGSIVQHTIANAYPGAVYDGLIVTCAYPDTFTAGSQFADYHMLRTYFEDPSRWGTGVVWTPAQWAAVEGRPDPVNAVVADEGLFKDAVNPSSGCVDPKLEYSSTNPGGVRCSILDYMKTLLGTRPRSVWSAPEKKAGKSFAGQPFSNVGVQYGLSALQQGLITPEMFVDLNEKIGGLDIDAKTSATRMAGDDSAIANSYRTGLVNETDHLDTVAIIDHAGPDPGAAHDYAHTWWVRDRLDKAHGQHGNQVLWFGPTPLIGDPTWPTTALKAMSGWLDAVQRDHTNLPLARRIVQDRPASLHDRCEYAPAVGSAPTDGVCLPQEAQTHYGTPREVAGGPATNDVLKCRLKPLSAQDYGLLGLTAAQLTRLRAVFPAGVCDWSRKGVGQQPVVPWQTYQDGRGRVIYGGTRMAPAHHSGS
ncbi:MAG: hypothetical protein JWO12_729 [Frankiales bacterium]|nr:hypothetical protein [Frankiales bacterium]